MSPRQYDDIPKQVCLVRFDQFGYWLSRTRDVAETYSYAESLTVN
jgi:hypothetical protein